MSFGNRLLLASVTMMGRTLNGSENMI